MRAAAWPSYREDAAAFTRLAGTVFRPAVYGWVRCGSVTSSLIHRAYSIAALANGC